MSKQNRQKRKQAKLQRRKQRQKRAETPSTPAPKQDPMRAMMAELENEEALSGMQSVINPPGQERMSEVLGQFIEPYVDAVDDVAAMQKLATLAVIAWNAAIVEGDGRKSLLESTLETVPEEVRADVAQMIEEMIRRKNQYFADNWRHIVKVQVTEVGDDFHLAVASLIPSDES